MAFTISNIGGPNVPYEGKVVPRDNAPYLPLPVTLPDVNYAGKNLPGDAVKYIAPGVDQTNLPNLIVLGTLASVANPFGGVITSPAPVTGAVLPNDAVILPADVMIRGALGKIIADTVIIDGVQVTEHIRRAAQRIELEFTVRARSNNEWVFGQDFLDALYQKVALPATVIYVQNTLLNRLGIQQLILRDFEYETIRGSINIPITLKVSENVPGESLIISTQ